jgi:DNA-binding MarR family transcriptional regulator
MLAPLARDMIAAEGPVLDAHGLSMWGYIVLAEAIGADKTRIIPTLDELQSQGFIERRPDPDDRRARLLALTDAGRDVKDVVQAAIQRGEERWLGTLSRADRAAFLRALEQLTDELD